VRCAAVNPVDYKIRQGLLKEKLAHKLPLVLGWDVAGVVVEAGSAANEFAPGDPVYSRPDIARDGAYAEYIAVKAHDCARKPERMAFAAAAGVPLTALTAWKALFDEGGLKSGQTVLVHAASGGVGSFAVQLAKAFHCQVIAVTSTPNVEMVKALGADRVIDYRKQDFARRCATSTWCSTRLAGHPGQVLARAARGRDARFGGVAAGSAAGRGAPRHGPIRLGRARRRAPAAARGHDRLGTVAHRHRHGVAARAGGRGARA